jgi:hypothetical protein
MAFVPTTVVTTVLYFQHGDHESVHSGILGSISDLSGLLMLGTS